MRVWSVYIFILGVHLVLVTDLIVLLTERDQKYHLASLQDWNVRHSFESLTRSIHVFTCT